MSKKPSIVLIDDSEILKRAKALGESYGMAQIVRATETPVMNGCDICATVINNKIINWSIYHDGEFALRFKSSQDAIQYLYGTEF